jgi:hypothetical protein
VTVGRRLRSASSAFERGEHSAVVTTLEPLLDDSARWTALGRADSRVAADAAYMGGISRLVVGDPDGAAAWLRLATDTPDVPPRIRRALAQVELARGEIDAARELLESGASLLEPADANDFLADTLARAREIENAACLDGADAFGITARVAAVFVSAAVRARVIAAQHDISPGEINRATLSWYQLHQLQRKALVHPAISAVHPTRFA